MAKPTTRPASESCLQNVDMDKTAAKSLLTLDKKPSSSSVSSTLTQPGSSLGLDHKHTLPTSQLEALNKTPSVQGSNQGKAQLQSTIPIMVSAKGLNLPFSFPGHQLSAQYQGLSASPYISGVVNPLLPWYQCLLPSNPCPPVINTQMSNNGEIIDLSLSSKDIKPEACGKNKSGRETNSSPQKRKLDLTYLISTTRAPVKHKLKRKRIDPTLLLKTNGEKKYMTLNAKGRTSKSCGDLTTSMSEDTKLSNSVNSNSQYKPNDGKAGYSRSLQALTELVCQIGHEKLCGDGGAVESGNELSGKIENLIKKSNETQLRHEKKKGVIQQELSETFISSSREKVKVSEKTMEKTNKAENDEVVVEKFTGGNGVDVTEPFMTDRRSFPYSQQMSLPDGTGSFSLVNILREDLNSTCTQQQVVELPTLQNVHVESENIAGRSKEKLKKVGHDSCVNVKSGAPKRVIASIAAINKLISPGVVGSEAEVAGKVCTNVNIYTKAIPCTSHGTQSFSSFRSLPNTEEREKTKANQDMQMSFNVRAVSSSGSQSDLAIPSQSVIMAGATERRDSQNTGNASFTSQLLKGSEVLRAFPIQAVPYTASNIISVTDRALLNMIKDKLKKSNHDRQHVKTKRALSDSDLNDQVYLSEFGGPTNVSQSGTSGVNVSSGLMDFMLPYSVHVKSVALSNTGEPSHMGKRTSKKGLEEDDNEDTDDDEVFMKEPASPHMGLFSPKVVGIAQPMRVLGDPNEEHKPLSE